METVLEKCSLSSSPRDVWRTFYSLNECEDLLFQPYRSNKMNCTTSGNLEQNAGFYCR